MTTNVPSPVFTPTGFVAPQESAILAGVQQDINTAFGGNLNFGTTGGSPTNPTPQGQLASAIAAIVGIVNDTFLFYTTQTDPAFSKGRMHDAIGRIYFIERIPATPTTLQITCTGAVGVTIPVQSTVADPAGNLYRNTLSGTIGANGTVGISFSAAVAGSGVVPSSVSIFQAITGWDTATIVSGVPGTNTETDAQFEARRALSTAVNSQGALPSIIGAVLSVPGVAQAFVYENTTSSPISFGGVTLAANSVYVAAFGGNPVAVATAIWTRKAPGCGYAAGNTTVTILDTSPGYSPPFPAYAVTYQIPNPLPLLLSVQIVNSQAVPATATTQIQQAVVNAVAGGANAQGIVDGPQATIGSKIWASRFVPPISALGTWAEGNVISIQIGSNNNPDAASSFGYCTGTSLYVTTPVSGTIVAGQTVSISNGSGTIVPGTTVVSQVSGSVGGTGVYTISTAQSFGLVNLLLQSNTFSSTWGSVNSTVTPNSGVSPDGTNDGWLWQRSGTAPADFFQQINVINGKPASALPYTFSIFAKAGIGPYLALTVTDQAALTAVNVTYNLLTGVVSNGPFASSGWIAVSASMQNAGNGWWRCVISVTTDTAPNILVGFSGNSNNALLGGSDSVSNSSILVYGAQLEVGGTANPYIATGATQVINTLLGLATPDQSSVQVQINQVPTIDPSNVVVSYV